ncbi:cytochrome C oxidase subunit IV family protein [Maribacter sp.]|uniref:cytochrome C oxidase subunit IV family protein n=1 Tax=Maribacter sp. TaxID=1897614 RepID=UPI0025BF23FB|nr:cytochrome C oxidase subunit IV family protein [Maribacter sp.]
MKKDNVMTWLFLMVLTIISVLFSTNRAHSIGYVILGLAAIKFIGVAFQFMEFKKAHTIWKTSIYIFLFLFVFVIVILLK